MHIFMFLATLLLLPFTFARPITDEPPESYTKALCKGGKLLNAMQLPARYAATYITPVESPWDGTLVPELAKWGYTERPNDFYCRLGLTWDMTLACIMVGINCESTDEGGLNKCYEVLHGDSENFQQYYTVDGKQYEVTGALMTVGINAQAGMIFFISVTSAAQSAEKYWGREPTDGELPALRSLSDITWGLWNREKAGDLGDIKALWMLHVVNDETREILRQVFKTYTPLDGRPRVPGPQTFPGTDFYTDTDEGKALLGSPNGIAPGYFVAQHKMQYGTNKVIERITAYIDDPTESAPTMIFWVSDEADMRKRNDKGQSYEGAEFNYTANYINEFATPKMLGYGKNADMLRVHIIKLGT